MCSINTVGLKRYYRKGASLWLAVVNFDKMSHKYLIPFRSNKEFRIPSAMNVVGHLKKVGARSGIWQLDF